MACKILIPQPGIKPGPQAVRLPSPNHLTAREFLIPYLSMKVKVLVTQSDVTPWTTDLQASLSMGFLRQEYWSGLPFSSPGNLFDPRIDPGLTHCRQILYTWKHQGSPPFYRFHQLEIHLIEHLLFERWNLNGVGRKVGEGWILNPCFTWVNMNYLKRESDRSLRRHSGNPHCGLGKEKERTFSVPRESGQRNYLHYSHPLEKYLFGRLELTAPIRLCLSIWVFPV